MKPRGRKKIVVGCAIGCILLVVALLVMIRLGYRFATKHTAPKPVDANEFRLPPNTVLEDGLAIAVLVDASGSMRDGVVDTDKTQRPKIDIAKRATQKVLDDIVAFTQKNPQTRVQVGVYQFNDGSVTPLVSMGPVSASVYPAAVDQLSAAGDTPIGEALIEGKKEINKSRLKKGYMIVVTDGENTSGRNPVEVVRVFKQLPETERPSVYFVAFNIQAARFKEIADQNVLILEAGNAGHLQEALDYILYQKILVEQPM